MRSLHLQPAIGWAVVVRRGAVERGEDQTWTSDTSCLAWRSRSGCRPVRVRAGQRLDRAQRDYEAAMAASDDGRRIELLERSYEEYETYEAAVALGETLLGMGEWGHARGWLGPGLRVGRHG